MEQSKSQWELDYLERQRCINGYARCCFQPRLRVVEKILVYPPAEFRRYLSQHPCSGCQAENFCDQPCAVYLKWYNARLDRARQKCRM